MYYPLTIQKTIAKPVAPVEVRLKNGEKKTILALSNGERKVLSRKLNEEKIMRDNYEIARQLAVVKNSNARALVENAVKKHHMMQQSMVEKSASSKIRRRE